MYRELEAAGGPTTRAAAQKALITPQKTFDWTLGGTGGIRNKGFIGEVNGKTVVLFVAKEGQYAGRVTSSKVVNPEDLKLWGICGC